MIATALSSPIKFDGNLMDWKSSPCSNVDQREQVSYSTLFELEPLDIGVAFVCFIAGFMLYVRTLAPFLLRGDSAEFQTLAYTLGITHPTGYAIYLLFAKMFITLLPIGSIAYRVSLFSAFLGALGLGLLYLVGRKWVGWRIASIVGTFKMATIGVFWSQAVIAELYTAAAALVVAEILLILLWRHKGNWHYLFLAGFLGGLSLGVHNMVALMAPAVLLYMALTVRRFQDWTGAAAGAGLGILIWLTTFLLLDGLNAPSSFFNSVVRPSLSTWGLRSADFDSPFERLIYLFSARQFRDFMFSQPISAMWGNSKAYFETVPWSIIIPSTLGMVSLFVRRWREGLLILVTWICMMIFVLNYDIRDIFVFYIPTYIPLLVTLIYFLGVLSDLANWFFRRLGASRWVNTKVGIFGVIVGLVLLLPGVKMVRDSVLLGSLTYYHEDTYPYPVFHPNLPYDQAKALVDHIEDNAIVFTDWEMLYAYYYVAHVEEGRTGMAFHESFPQGGINDLAETARAYIQANLGARPIYVTRFMPQFTRYFVLKRVLAEVPLYQVEARPY